MLQQTTVSTVKNHFERFLKKFPDLQTLASATDDELLVAWKGLGYYRRARNLKKIAEQIVSEHAGVVPSEISTLLKIPGIGPYTANALVGIGMDHRALAIDANLERVLSRYFGLESQKGLPLQRKIQELFLTKKIFTEKISFRELNEALMDLGRTFCQARKASCELCPLKDKCKAFEQGSPLRYPKDKVKKKISTDHELHLLRILVMKKDKLLVYRKGEDQWLSGQYEVPTFILATTDEALKQYPRLQYDLSPKHPSFKTGITKYKILNSLVEMTEKEFKALSFPLEVEWRSVSSEEANFSTTTLKALARVGQKAVKV